MMDYSTQFELAFAELYGVSYALAMSSGTSAYLTALLALGLGAEREVLVPAYAWPQLLAAPAALGCRVRMVDCDENGRMSEDAVARSLGRRTGAIIVCHLFGNPVNVCEIVRMAARAGVPVIEDCSQSLLASQHGRLVGTWGDFGFASLGRGKALCAGEGGLLWTHRHDLYRTAFHFSQHPDRAPRSVSRGECLVRSLSLRIHPSGARAALRDLNTLRSRVLSMSAHHEELRVLIRDAPGVRIVTTRDDVAPAWQHFPLLVDPGIAEQLQGLLWDKQPAYLLSRSRNVPRARAFAGRVRFIETGRKWENVPARTIEKIAGRIAAARA